MLADSEQSELVLQQRLCKVDTFGRLSRSRCPYCIRRVFSLGPGARAQIRRLIQELPKARNCAVSGALYRCERRAVFFSAPDVSYFAEEGWNVSLA